MISTNYLMTFHLKSMYKFKKFLLLLFLTEIFVSFGQRPGIPPVPNPQRLVNNLSKEFPNFITQDEQNQLETKLVAFSKETSNQIVVIIIDDLAGYEPWDFATELGYQWKVGKEKEDNGIVLLIKPTGGPGERKTHIAVGRGLEGAIPDLTSNRIVEKELIPNFKEGNFYKGIDEATNVIMKLAKGEINQKDYNKESDAMGFFGAIFILIIIFFVVWSLFSKGKPGSRGGSGGLGRAITYGAIGSMFGGGGSSSSGGGGFGGFGGGSFGGGGSGGSW
jgi:uncharacterized protein